jgi:hypothetical protein
MRRLLCNNQKLHIYLISRVITTSKSVTFPQVMSLKTCGKGRTISKSSQSDNRKKKHTKHEVFWTWHKTPGVNTKHEVFWTCTRFTWCDTKHEVFWTWRFEHAPGLPGANTKHEVFWTCTRFTWCGTKHEVFWTLSHQVKHKTRSVLNMTQNMKCFEHAVGKVFWTLSHQVKHKTRSVLNMHQVYLSVIHVSIISSVAYGFLHLSLSYAD